MGIVRNSPEIQKAILTRYAAGESLRHIGMDPDMPNCKAIYVWVRKNSKFRTAFQEIKRQGPGRPFELSERSPWKYALDAFYSDWAKKLGLTPEQMLEIARMRCSCARRRGLSVMQVLRWGLDNPFMSELAWETMFGMALKDSERVSKKSLAN